VVRAERNNELSFLRRRLDDAAQGNGSITILTGPVAVGKTTTLHSFADNAKQSGALVLSATASRSERALPFGVVEQLYGPWMSQSAAEHIANVRHSVALTDSSKELEARVGPRATPQVEPHIVHSLCAAPLSLAESAPLVISIDDAHYADAQSLECLLYLVRRLKSSRIMIVGNECARPHASRPLLLAELMRQPFYYCLQLAPLSVHDVFRLLTDELGAEVPREFAASCHLLSGGNPLLVRALLNDNRAVLHSIGDSEASQPVLAGAFRQAVVDLLYRDEPPTQQVAQAVAVLGGPTSATLLDRLLGLETGLAGVVVEALHGSGLFESGHFRHPEMCRAVLDSMSADERAELHGRVARLLYHDGAPVTEVARHLLLAGIQADPWVTRVLREAAQQALDGDQPMLAVECLRRAHQSCVDERQRAVVKVKLMAAEWRINPAIAARRLPELITALHDGLLQGRHAVTPIGFLLWYGNVDDALDAVERLNGAYPTDPDAVDALNTTMLWFSYSYPALADRMTELKTGIQQSPCGGAGPQPHAAAAMAAVFGRGSRDEVVASAEQVLQRFRLAGGTLIPIVAAVEALVCADELEQALRWCVTRLEEAAARRFPAWQAVFAAIRAGIAVRQGDLSVADHFSDLALTHICPRSWGVAVGVALASRLIVATEMGRFDDAARLLEVPVPKAMFQTLFGLRYLTARGRYYLATNRPHAALGDFEACGELLARWRLELPAIAPWRTDAAAALISLGAAERARELLRAQLELASEPSRIRGVALRLLAAISKPERRPRLLREAADILSACGARLELARTLADLGQAQRELKDFHHARTTLAQALNMARECRADMLVRRLVLAVGTGDVDKANGNNAHVLDALTDAERRVAILAARGHTNREIAKRLFITVSTVEQHLTKTYRKLNVDRRADLPTAIVPTQMPSDRPAVA
jgi:DNA-binding CsgD family transcriptional regulator